MIAGRRLPKMAVPVTGLSVLLTEVAWAADGIRGKVLGAAPIPRSTEALGEASADVTEKLPETRVNDGRFAARSDSTNGNAALSAVAYL
jgi:hypothetical protein